MIGCIEIRKLTAYFFMQKPCKDNWLRTIRVKIYIVTLIAGHRQDCKLKAKCIKSCNKPPKIYVNIYMIMSYNKYLTPMSK